MEVVITALGPDNVGLADPIIHHVTGRGARIAEIQMYDHDDEQLFAMLCRIDIERSEFEPLVDAMRQIGEHTRLAIRVWSSELRATRPRLAICGTFVEHTPRAVLQAVAEQRLNAESTVMISNRNKLAGLADEFGVPFRMIGGDKGTADDSQMVEILDEFDVDYVILARYMRILPASTCWQFAGGRIINLHHGLLPGSRASGRTTTPIIPACSRLERPATSSSPNLTPETKPSTSAPSPSPPDAACQGGSNGARLKTSPNVWSKEFAGGKPRGLPPLPPRGRAPRGCRIGVSRSRAPARRYFKSEPPGNRTDMTPGLWGRSRPEST